MYSEVYRPMFYIKTIRIVWPRAPGSGEDQQSYWMNDLINLLSDNFKLRKSLFTKHNFRILFTYIQTEWYRILILDWKTRPRTPAVEIEKFYSTMNCHSNLWQMKTQSDYLLIFLKFWHGQSGKIYTHLFCQFEHKEFLIWSPGCPMCN